MDGGDTKRKRNICSAESVKTRFYRSRSQEKLFHSPIIHHWFLLRAGIVHQTSLLYGLANGLRIYYLTRFTTGDFVCSKTLHLTAALWQNIIYNSWYASVDLPMQTRFFLNCATTFEKFFVKWLFCLLELKHIAQVFCSRRCVSTLLQIEKVNIGVCSSFCSLPLLVSPSFSLFLSVSLFLFLPLCPPFSLCPCFSASTCPSTHTHVHISIRAKHNCCHGELFLDETCVYVQSQQTLNAGHGSECIWRCTEYIKSGQRR